MVYPRLSNPSHELERTTLNLQDKSYKIPVSTNVPIELTPGSPILRKMPTKEEITSNDY